MIFNSSRCQGRLLAATLLSIGCFMRATEQPYDPFLVPADTVRSAVNNVIVTPAGLPEGILVSPMAASRIDSVIEARLRQSGYSVVPAAEYSRIWDGILRQMGGFFDPITGQRDEEKFGTARKELLRELKGRFDTQVLLYVELQVVDAGVDDGVASWDGATHNIRGDDSPIGAAFSDTFERDEFGRSADGVVSAITLMVAIDGPGGKELYRNFGGVEVLARRQGSVGEDEGDFELRAELGRILAAVDRALGPLIGPSPRTTPPDGQTGPLPAPHHPTGRRAHSPHHTTRRADGPTPRTHHPTVRRAHRFDSMSR